MVKLKTVQVLKVGLEVRERNKVLKNNVSILEEDLLAGHVTNKANDLQLTFLEEKKCK